MISRRPTRGVASGFVLAAIVVLAVVAVVAASLLARPSTTTSSATISPGTNGSAVLPTLSGSPAAPTSAVATAASSPTPRGQWANTKYGYTVVLPEPYHVSPVLTREFGGAHPAARDVFTVLSRAEEDAAMQGQDCEVQCSALNGAAVILIYTDAGSMTPRQWFEAGNTPGSPGTLTDVTIGGRPALKIQPSGKYNVMYVVADGKGRMFELAYEFFHIATAPPGATIAKVEQLFASFSFT